MILVNSVVLVRGQLGLDNTALAWTMFAFGGAGSMISALALPRLLDRFPDRPVMITGAWLMVAALLGIAVLVMTIGLTWPLLLAVWLLIGLGNSAVLTPSGLLLRRSAHPEDRPAIFAAQFALSHACWLVTYPLSGWLMTAFGTVPTLLVLASFATLGIGMALRVWPADAPDSVTHGHPDLPPDHPISRVKEARATDTKSSSTICTAIGPCAADVLALSGLFSAAFLAATLIPAQSEAVLVGLLWADMHPVRLIILVATAGNVLGSVVNWILGRYLSHFAGRRWFPVSEKQMEQTSRWYQKWGLLEPFGGVGCPSSATR